MQSGACVGNDSLGLHIEPLFTGFSHRERFPRQNTVQNHAAEQIFFSRVGQREADIVRLVGQIFQHIQTMYVVDARLRMGRQIIVQKGLQGGHRQRPGRLLHQQEMCIRDSPEGVTDIPEGFELVPVTVGISDNTNVEIVDGIEDGTEIFLAGPKDMFDQNSGGELVVG